MGYLRKAREGTVSLPEGQRLCMVADIVCGMEYLHRQGYIHRDLKSPNVLIHMDVDDKGTTVPRCKVADFGLARMVNDQKKLAESQNVVTHSDALMTGKAGSPCWMAPELITQMYEDGLSSYGAPVDVFSFGIIMYELLSCRAPFEENAQSAQAVMHFIESGGRPTLNPDILSGAAPGYVPLMKDCWDQEPSQRPSFAVCARRIADIRAATVGTRTHQMLEQGNPQLESRALLGGDGRTSMAHSQAAPGEKWPQAVSDNRLATVANSRRATVGLQPSSHRRRPSQREVMNPLSGRHTSMLVGHYKPNAAPASAAATASIELRPSQKRASH